MHAINAATITSALGYTPPAQDTTYAEFVGATTNTAGSIGLVPSPAAGETTKLL